MNRSFEQQCQDDVKTLASILSNALSVYTNEGPYSSQHFLIQSLQDSFDNGQINGVDFQNYSQEGSWDDLFDIMQQVVNQRHLDCQTTQSEQQYEQLMGLMMRAKKLLLNANGRPDAFSADPTLIHELDVISGDAVNQAQEPATYDQSSQSNEASQEAY